MKLLFSLLRAPLYACGALVILCLVGCKQPDKNISPDVPQGIVAPSQNVDIFENLVKDLPQDLLYQGVPIHPSCIIATFQDNLPKPVSIQELHKNISEDDRGIDYTFSYDSKRKTCSASWKLFPYGYDPKDPEIADIYPAWFDGYEHEASYTYIGSYKNQHIIVTRQDCSGSRGGPNSMLGIITRDDKTICCAWGRDGDFAELSFEGNLLRFEKGSVPARIDDIMPRENIVGIGKDIMSIANELPEYDEAFYCLYQVNLDDPLLIPSLYGISFGPTGNYWNFKFEDEIDEKGNYLCPKKRQEECFNTVVMQYIDAGNKILDLAQTESFVKEVWQSIGQMIALNEYAEK